MRVSIIFVLLSVSEGGKGEITHYRGRGIRGKSVEKEVGFTSGFLKR